MHLPDNYRFFCPVKISAGARALDHLPWDLGGTAAGIPLVVADSRRRAAAVVGAFGDSGMSVCVCDDVAPAPDMDTVRGLAELYRRKGCGSLVAAGGGALIDAAKLVNALVSSGGDDLERACSQNDLRRPSNPLAVALSGAGNGLEVSRFAALGDRVFSSAGLMPELAVIDPRLLAPEKVEALVQLGLASLSHAVEAFCGAAKNPMSDAYAHAAMRLVVEHLLAVAGGGADRAARTALVNGAALAGCALSNTGPGMLHLLAEAAAGDWGLPLGQVMGMLLPYAMEYRALNGGPPCAELLLPLAGPEVYSQTAEGLRKAIAVNIVHALIYDLNKATRGAVRLTLKESGVDPQGFPGLAGRASAAGPGVCHERGALMVLEHAWSGYPIVAL